MFLIHWSIYWRLCACTVQMFLTHWSIYWRLCACTVQMFLTHWSIYWRLCACTVQMLLTHWSIYWRLCACTVQMLSYSPTYSTALRLHSANAFLLIYLFCKQEYTFLVGVLKLSVRPDLFLLTLSALANLRYILCKSLFTFAIPDWWVGAYGPGQPASPTHIILKWLQIMPICQPSFSPTQPVSPTHT